MDERDEQTSPLPPADGEVTPVVAGIDDPAGENRTDGDDGAAMIAGGPADDLAGEPFWRGLFATLRASMDTYAAGWRTFLPLSASIAIFSAVLAYVSASVSGTRGRGATTVFVYALIFLGLMVAAAIVDATDAIRSAQPRSATQAFQMAVRRFRSIFGAWLIVWLAVAGVGIVFAIPLIGAVIDDGFTNISKLVPWVAIAAVGVALITYLLFRWSMVAQGVLLEGLGARGSLARSWSFTKGRVIRLGFLSLFVALAGIGGTAGEVLVSVSSKNPLLVAVATFVAAFVLTPLPTIAMTIAFRDLTGRRDAPGLTLSRKWPLVLVVFLVVDVLLLAAGIGAFRSGNFTLPTSNRGGIVTGTSSNPADGCSPTNPRTVFSSADQIWLAATFTRRVEPGVVMEVQFSRDAVELGVVPITSGPLGAGCYYEIAALTGLSPGTYRVRVTEGTEVLAEGEFTVR